MQSIHDAVLDSIAACGDVTRNVMCNPNPYQSDIYAEVNRAAAVSVNIYCRKQRLTMKSGWMARRL